tara:strand:+ start:192 stop:485 length:294 start_codon:yes stop_codon:yes gene_type:complete
MENLNITLQSEAVNIEDVDFNEHIATLHTIEVDYLNVGNNFTFEHFKSALKEHEQYEDIKDYIRSIHYLDEFKIIANGNYGKVDSSIILVDEYEVVI